MNNRVGEGASPNEKRSLLAQLSNPMKYTENYTVEEVADERGKTRKKVRYLGVWACPEQKGTLWRLVAGAVLALLGVAALCRLQMMSYSAAGCWYVKLPQLAALFPGLNILAGLTNLPWRRKPQPWDRYERGILKCCRNGVAVAVLMAISLLPCTLIWWKLNPEAIWSEKDTAFAAVTAAEAVLAFASMAVFRSISIHSAPNEAVRQE